MSKIGIYIHVPFCKKKCDYCDFYSVENGYPLFETYENAVIAALRKYGQEIKRTADTLYFGGGTPSLLPPERIGRIIDECLSSFGLDGAEITLECNPSTVYEGYFEKIAEAGVNRVSLGLQSAIDEERKLLGRISSSRDALNAVTLAKNAGILNVSLDLMLGIPNQTKESLKRSVDFAAGTGARHISAYILKAEKNTPLYKRRNVLPTDDEQAELYLEACEEIKKCGYIQYEISNFCKEGFESRHNLKYWKSEEYLGIGPAAHSFIDSKRFYYPRSVRDFISGCAPVPDGEGGDYDEFAMLRLRLSEGLSEKMLISRFGRGFSKNARAKIPQFEKSSLLTFDGDTLRLTEKGFLVSNYLIAEILE